MPGRDECVFALGQLDRRRVAHVPRPRLQVARLALLPAHAHDLKLHPQLLAQGRTVALVRVGLRSAQPVVHVQRPHAALPPERDRHIEQADRVAAAREHRHDRVGGQTILPKQASPSHRVADLLDDHDTLISPYATR